MTNLLLLKSLLYVGIGCLEWALALRRTLAVARGERSLLVVIVFIENLVSLWVLSKFIITSDWLIAICYSIGGSLGSLMVVRKNKNGKNIQNL